jgi:hypothetical protein
MKQNLEQIFSKAEIKTIIKFTEFVASDNQSNENFSVSDTDESVKNEIKEWLNRRYAAGHGKRRKA